MTHPPEREIGHEMVGALHRSSGSFELVGGAVIAALVGFGLDRLFGLTPVLTLLFAVAGLVGASYSIWLNYQINMAAAADDRAQRRDGGSAS